jgi:hypothetical protein
MSEFRCAEASFARDEPIFATASHVDRWLMVEQSGPFSAESVPAGRISREALAHLSRLANQAGARLVLIRRPPRLPPENGLRVFSADVRPDHERLRTLLIPDADPLAALALDGPGWTPLPSGIFLVCTHGKHDPCCAVYGRPVVAALSEALERGRVWETSHIGGDRFAANVVALPSGLYLGRVEPEEAAAVAELIDSGRVPVHYLRGRSSITAPGQAAQHFARTVGGYSAYSEIGDLLPHTISLSPEDGRTAWTVILACPAGDVSVTVRRINSTGRAQLTCHVEQPKLYPVFELVRMHRLRHG